MNKKAITAGTIIGILVGVLLLNSPKKSAAHAQDIPKTERKLTQTQFTIVIPYGTLVVDGVQDVKTQEYPPLAADNGARLYTHCESCRMGVYSKLEDGRIVCTYCNKPQHNPANE